MKHTLDSRRSFLLKGLGAGAALATGPGLLGSARAQASDYPNRPIRLIVPFPAGQGSDLAARLLTDQMNKTLPQRIIIENRGGSDGSVGVASVARAKPDGYLLAFGTNATHAANAAYGNLPYDPVADFDPIGLFYGGGMVLLVAPNSPVQNVQQFIALAKANPGVVNVGIASTTSRVVLAMMREGFGIDIVAVPYKGATAVLTDLLGGHIPFAIESMTATVPRIQGGELRALVISPPKASRLLPNIPTLEESGATKGSSLGTWTAFFGPKGTPVPVLNTLNKAMNDGIRTTQVQEFLARVGSDSLIVTPAEAAQHVQNEVKRWAEIIKKYNIKQV